MYLGDRKTEATHTQSGSSFLTDQSTDTEDYGESFSPTDLISTAVLTSMFTRIGSTASTHDLLPGNISGEIHTTIKENPVRVSALDMEIRMQGHYLDDAGKKLLEAAALSCPASRSIHPDIQLVVKFTYE